MWLFESKGLTKQHSHYGSAFVRLITYVMPIDEYDRVHGTLKSIKEYKLVLNIIMGDVPIVATKQGMLRRPMHNYLGQRKLYNTK